MFNLYMVRAATLAALSALMFSAAAWICVDEETRPVLEVVYQDYD